MCTLRSAPFSGRQGNLYGAGHAAPERMLTVGDIGVAVSIYGEPADSCMLKWSQRLVFRRPLLHAKESGFPWFTWWHPCKETHTIIWMYDMCKVLVVI